MSHPLTVPRPSRLVLVLALAAGLLLPNAATTAQDAETAPVRRLRPHVQELVVDVTFPGGTADDFIAAVRRAAGEVNVVGAPYLDLVPIEPVVLQRVPISAALGLLQNRYDLDDDRTVEVRLDMTPARAEGHRPVYRLLTEVRSPRRSPRVAESTVWSLRQILDGGMTPEDVLSALEVALELFGDSYPPARLRFHRETGLLIGRANPAQIESINDLLSRLQSDSKTAQAGARTLDQKAADDQVAIARRETVVWQTRAEVLTDEITILQTQHAKLREEYQAEIDEQRRVIAELRTRIRHLEAEIVTRAPIGTTIGDNDAAVARGRDPPRSIQDPPVPRSAAELSRRIASGDTEAFAVFYRAWFDRMLAEARRVTKRDEAFCLDVVQDAMMRVIRVLKPMPTEAALARWVQLTVRSCACDQLRQETRRRRRERAVAGRDHATADDRQLAAQLAWLEGELRALDRETATLLYMRHRLGWTLGRIADTVGSTVGAVDGRLRRVVAGLGRRAKEELDA